MKRGNYDFSDLNILVIGDFMLDEYIFGDVNRISPEAPVPVLKVGRKQLRIGGAGNVVNNLCSLKAHARVLTCIGEDDTGSVLMESLKKCGADISYVVVSNSVVTTKKTRIIAKTQQVIRIDNELLAQDYTPFKEYVRTNLESIFASVSAVILSDYGKGILDEELAQLIIREANKRNLLTFVDPKGSNWDKYRGASICTPNFSELCTVYGSCIEATDEEMIRVVARDVCARYKLSHLLVTRSELGMSLIDPKGKKLDFPVKKKVEVIDVSGAGDTVISMFALALTSGMSMSRCCELSNRAASVVISKLGTSPVTLEELTGDLSADTVCKRLKIGELQGLSENLHKSGKRIVFTNGCFDIMHRGHIKTLEQAHSFGDVLIVGVNSDSSVKRLKGETRPIINEDDRAYLLQSLSVVDYVVIFDDDTPYELIKLIQPDILVKGEDYRGKTIVGQEIVEKNGGRVELVDFVEGHSTTGIVKKIQSLR